MDIRRLDETIVLNFITRNGTTGTVSDADSTPICAVFEGDNDTAILTPTVSKRTSLTGHYRVAIDLTSANGFELGKSYAVVISATVGSISDKEILSEFYLEAVKRPTGSVVSDAGNTASAFKSDLSSPTTDAWKDALIAFATGTLAGQVKKISAYDGSTKFVTVSSSFTGAPSSGDIFVIINA
jgi:hypothetical protein